MSVTVWVMIAKKTVREYQINDRQAETGKCPWFLDKRMKTGNVN